MALKDEKLNTNTAIRFSAITTHDTNEIELTRAIFCGWAGTIVVKDVSWNAITFTWCLAWVVYPIQTKIITTASTATNMVALY